MNPLVQGLAPACLDAITGQLLKQDATGEPTNKNTKEPDSRSSHCDELSSTIKRGYSKMIMLPVAFILSATRTPNSVQHIDALVRLGKERAMFVDKITKDFDGDRKWNSEWLLENGQSEAFFPVGSSDRRYYLTWSGYKPTKHYLSYQSFHSGAVNRIWIIELSETKSEPKEHFDGTLWKLLRRRGLIPKGHVPKLASGSLNATKCFAGYYWNNMDGGDYWFVYEDGFESKSAKAEWGGDVRAQLGSKSLSRSEMYEKVVPYPITAQETERLRNRK